MAKRGRPTLAAQTQDEALHAVYTGTAPKRPRNDHERAAGAKRRGRPPSPVSRTGIAAQLAEYLMVTEGLSEGAALERACHDSQPPGAKPLDRSNVRKYLRRRMSPTVLSRHSGRGLFPGFPKPEPHALPLLHSVETVSAD